MTRYEHSVRRHSWKSVIEDKLGAILGLVLLLCAAPLLRAHHGRAAFDTTHAVKMQGTVTGLNWVNPHAVIYASIKAKNGKATDWRLELGSLRMLTQYGGWTEDTVKLGERITVQGFLANNGSPNLSVSRIWLPDGRSLEGKP